MSGTEGHPKVGNTFITTACVKSGNKYIHLVVDHLTKWMECYALPNQKAEVVAKSLEVGLVDGFIVRFGCQIQIHSDQGRNIAIFDGIFFGSLCGLLEIAKTGTIPYQPSVNGQVERYN